jgi:RNA polymerase sigma factor (TIGR02999 family)
MSHDPVPAPPSPDADPPIATGDPAVDRLVPLLYDELRRVARRQLRREQAGHTLTTTALVHEAYLRLAGAEQLADGERGRFLGIAARVMRQVLIDYARRGQARKRGGVQRRVSLSGIVIPAPAASDTLLGLDEALRELATASPRLAQVVECRFFGGLTEEETGLALGVTPRTIRRDWLKARAWLAHSLGEGIEGQA